MILAVDPGLAAMGYAVLALNGAGIEFGVLRTAPSPKKQRTLAIDDNLRRVREIAHDLNGLIYRHGVKVLAAEAMSFPRSSSSAAKLAMSWAAFATLSELRGLPLVQASPQMVRRALSGAGSCKDDMAVVVRARLGAIAINAPPSLHDHAYDAAAVGLYVLNSDVVRALRGRAA